MIVGFTITDFNGHEKDAVKFIRKVCILEDPSIADNIVSAGVGINIYSKCLSQELLDSQPFSCRTINTIEGKFLVASAVDFPLELKYGNDLLAKLQPTEYLYVDERDIKPFVTYMKQGLVVVIPKPIGDTPIDNDWILAHSIWNDEGIWVDTEIWRED